MLALILCSQFVLADLDTVYSRVRALKGVEIHAEMVRPSVIAMQFKIAPGGYLWAKYPTSEEYITTKAKTTWFPDRREYARAQPEDQNPLPAGFEALWPGGKLLKQEGASKEAEFAGQKAIEITCKGPMPHLIRLFVSPTTLIPLGTIATSGSITFEMRYTKVDTRPIHPKSIQFVPPKDARPYVERAPDAKLVKPGAKLSAISVKDANGKVVSLRGKKLLLNFWFSACTGCIQEMPYLSKLEPKLRQAGITLVGVNPIDDAKTTLRTSKTNNLPFPTVVGSDAKKLADWTGVIAYPVTLVVDEKGAVVDSILGFNEARLEKALRTLGYSGG